MTTPLQQYLQDCVTHVNQLPPPIELRGKLTRVSGLVLEAVGLKLPVGSVCQIHQAGMNPIEAEVVGFAGDRLFLMPYTEIYGLAPGATVLADDSAVTAAHSAPTYDKPYQPEPRTQDRTKHLPVGDELLGRVIDPNGRPLDKKGELIVAKRAPLQAKPFNPMDREPVHHVLDTGVRVINAMLTVGRGQRLGLFAGSGVGKSVLIGMMARYTKADVTVVGLIGERGREVKEFIEEILGEEGLRRSVVVAAPADTPPLMRLQGAAYATLIAEYFRDQGKNVLLVMDSLTRYAMAQREIALAIGEPPATKGYPPSVFARLPQLVERAGNGLPGSGSITAFYTVLSEGDDQQDPIADNARAILDGHFVLTRQLAEAGHYPAIDVEQSISRVMHSIVSPEHLSQARLLKSLFAKYQRNKDLVAVGAYVAGSDPMLDRAIALYPRIEEFLQQGMLEQSEFEPSQQALQLLLM